MKGWRSIALGLAASALVGCGAAGLAAEKQPLSEARTFPHDDGVVDLLVIGPAAKLLYDRLPDEGVPSECGALGLHKGDDGMRCVKNEGEYSCHIWLDVQGQSLAAAQIDDC